MLTRLVLLVGSIAVAMPAAAGEFDYLHKRPNAKDGYAYPDCYCLNRDERVEMGNMACIRVGKRQYTARCGMSLNNPAWRFVEDGCEPQKMSSL